MTDLLKLTETRAVTQEKMDYFLDGPSEEEERDFWNGEGNLVFTVLSNRPDVFEINIEEYSGCVGGFNEGIGIEWGLKDGYLDIDPSELHEGYTYYCDEITVSWYKGDGWTTDDDSDYYVGNIRSERLPLIKYLKLKLHNAWWFNIGWRINQWQRKRHT
jgi:hypothetical protein